ncbi:MAG: hypothetical protein U5J95_05670 [Balneolaceae bacterium]|nr:hypothetical protein [Balneolaceae bacterium]
MNDKAPFIKYFLILPAVFLLLNISIPSFAQQADQSQATEVYLTFQYRGVFNVYVTAYYQDDKFYLPVSEIFNALQINQSVDQGNLTVSGTYLGEKEYYFDFSPPNPKAQAGSQEVLLNAEDFLIKEIDYFVRPEIFDTLFELNFSIDFNNLNLSLETTDKMPVVAQYEREQKRQQLDRNQTQLQQSYYPLQYDRSYNALDGAFLDYNISSIFTGNTELFLLSNSLGVELAGGDLQGNTFAAFSNNQSSFTTNGLRWRYVQRDNEYFTSAIVGQTNSEGMGNRSITGVKVSNKPVEPRILFDRYVVDGTAPAQSEVELYLNNQLVDFQETDQSGNYRFVVPLTYGSTNYSVRIYTPEGRAINRESRLQVPFDYLPAGEVDYTASFGQLSNPLFGTANDEGYHAEGTVSAGLSNWLTAQTSAEYITTFHDQLPSFTGTLNARLLSKYLVSVNANTENFYRFTSSVVYSSGASWNLSYDYNPGESRLFNAGGNDHQARVNLFTPFVIGNVPLNMRWSSTYLKNGPTSLVRYRADLSSRVGKLNIRFGYRDQQITPLKFTNTISSRLTNSYTYSLGRTQNIPKLIRGAFLRGQLSYLPGFNKLEEVEFQFSREFLNTGRVQLSYSRNFLRDFNSISLNLTLNFNKVRSNTTSRTNGSQFSINQSLRGSVGYDSYEDQIILNNRQQVGQAGVAVRLFVDNNNDGAYQDSLDDVISEPAVRLERAGGRTFVDDGVNYITQLLPYYRYNIQINKSALSNPLLVPDIDNFSIVTDPNQFKKVEIPFYLSGVISGRVEQLQSDSTLRGLGGVRVVLESSFDDQTNRDPIIKELRTFSDGSFYTYEIPPGQYRLFVDPNQLDFLNATSRPDTLDFEVEALAQGDFVENLNFVIEPNDLEFEETIVAQNQDTNKKSTGAIPDPSPFLQ